MKTYLLSGVAALGLVVAGAASAADLPSRKGPVAAPVYVAPAFTWTGFYIGANAGYGWADIKTRSGIGANVFGDADGFVGGGQVGYNYQIGQIVLGVEADLQYSDLSARPTVAFAGLVNKAEIEYFGTVRGRLGFAFDRFMPYVTAGFAYANVKAQLNPLVTLNGVNSDDNMHWGYTVGAGVEYAITNNLTAKVEYLYADFEKKNYFNGGLRAGADLHVVRGGLNYKF